MSPIIKTGQCGLPPKYLTLSNILVANLGCIFGEYTSKLWFIYYILYIGARMIGKENKLHECLQSAIETS